MKRTNKVDNTYLLPSRKPKKITPKLFASWEMILFYIFVVINIVLMSTVPATYFSHGTVPTIIRSGLDLSFMVLAMIFILILGEIDVSVASIMIFSTMITGLLCKANCPGVVAMLMGILAGAALGFINGVLVAYLRLPSVIVTIATSLLFRGMVQGVLGSNYLDSFPSFYSTIAWYDIGGVIPLVFVIFIGFAIIFGVILHKTTYGRQLYMIGNNKLVARFNGIRVRHITVSAFVIMGIMSALSGVVFAGRLNGITYSMGTGYELKVIAIAVLGGVSTLGGKGNVVGPIISTFVMCFLAKMLDFMDVHPNVQKIITGCILIAAVLIPLINKQNLAKLKSKFTHKPVVVKEDDQVNSLKNSRPDYSFALKQARINLKWDLKTAAKKLNTNIAYLWLTEKGMMHIGKKKQVVFSKVYGLNKEFFVNKGANLMKPGQGVNDNEKNN